MLLEICGVRKYYGKKCVLDNIDLQFGNGIYAVLGPNGAGKSTLISIITGVRAPSEGCILFNGKDTRGCEKAFLDSLGYMPQSMPFYKNFTAQETMVYIGVLKGLTNEDASKRGRELLERVNLSHESNKKVKAFSGGMRQRLGIAQALISDPAILIFDEPTAGLDPRERIRFRNVISKLAQDKTVLICTHIVSDIDAIADQVILLKHGQVISQKTPKELCSKLNGKLWDVNVHYKELETYLGRYEIYHVSRNNDVYHLRILSEEKPSETAKTATVTLEDVYLYYFNEENDNVFSI